MAGSKHTKKYCWWTEGEKIAISQTSDGVNFSGPSAAGDVISIKAISFPELFTVDNASPHSLSAEIPGIPDQFSQAIIDKISAWLYENDAETIQLAQYHEAKYEKYIKEAKSYAGDQKISQSAYAVKPYDF
jgi:hypothetical protein